VDKAGNRSTRDVPVKVGTAAPPPTPDPRAGPTAPTATVTAITFPGFTNTPGTEINKLGYPQTIVDGETKIELVAVPSGDVKPTLYVGRTLVTVQQFDGTGTTTPRQGLAGYEIQEFLRGRGRGLELLTEAEFDSLPANSRIEQLRDGPSEWLKPTNAGDKSWPIRKAGTRTQYDSKNPLSTGFAFRVCFRPPQ
jgi:hypothetical protein